MNTAPQPETGEEWSHGQALGRQIERQRQRDIQTLHAGESGTVERALRALVEKLTAVERDSSFQGIWGFLHAHGYTYSGPDWRDALADARTALSSSPAQGGVEPPPARLTTFLAVLRGPGPLHQIRKIAADEIEQLHDYIKRNLASPPPQGWRGIESAPKDGTSIWVSNGFSMRVAFWADGKQYEHQGSVGGGWRDYFATEMRSTADLMWAPTHWMPLPASPAPAADTARM